MCEVCEHDIARAVHHILPVEERPDIRLDWRNLLSVCSEACHRQAEADRVKWRSSRGLEVGGNAISARLRC